MKSEKKPQLAKSELVKMIPAACQHETAAVEFIEAQRWGANPCCVHCGSTNVYKMTNAETGHRNKRYLWRCRDCKEQYTVRIGTVYEDSRLPLRHWCYAFWRAATSKKGVSALEIQRQCQISYKSALFLLHRIRFSMMPENDNQPKLTGIVEADETFIGGKPRRRTPNVPGKPKWYCRKDKAVVFAAVQRGGNVRVRPIADITAVNVKQAVNDLVDKSSRLITDEWRGYPKIGAEYARHDMIKHAAGQYAIGDITTNTIEGFFSILKRGLHGIYHSVSKEHLPKYLAEFEFRYNGRKLNDGQRTALAIKGADGKRLMYRQPIDPPKAPPTDGEQLLPF